MPTAKGPTASPPCSGRSARRKTSSAPVSPVAKRSTKVAIETAQMPRSMEAEAYPPGRHDMLALVPGRPDSPVPPEIVALAEQRAAAREARDWRAADALRRRIETAGFRIVDDGLAFTLAAARPSDVTEAGITFHGAPESVPSRLDEPESRATSLVVLVDPAADEPIGEVVPGDHGLTDAQVLLVASRAAVEAGHLTYRLQSGAELVGMAASVSPGDALTAGLRRANGSRIAVLDGARTVGRDLIAQLLAALDDPTVAVAGALGYRSTDLRRFEPATPGDVTALGSGCYAFRRADASRRLPVDGRLGRHDSVAVWWSLALRDEGADRAPRRAIALEPWPATGGQEPNLPSGETRLARRDAYRIADRFGGNPWLADGAEQVAGMPGDRAHGDEQDDGGHEEGHAGNG